MFETMRSDMRRLGSCVFFALVGLGMSAGPGYAMVSTTGCVLTDTCTLTELFAGGSISIDDTIFRDWTLNVNNAADGVGTAAAASDLDNILVAGLDDDPLNPGLRYAGNGELAVGPGTAGSGGDLKDLNWEFVVADTTGALNIKDNRLALEIFTIDDTVSPNTAGTGGIIDVFEEACEVAGCLVPPGDSLAVKNTKSDNAIEDERLSEDVDFTAPVAEAVVQTDVYLEIDEDTNTVELDAFEQRFSLVAGPGPPPLSCPECDLSGDGVVDFNDLAAVFPCMGQPASNPVCAFADVNGDGIINFNDVSFIVSNFS